MRATEVVRRGLRKTLIVDVRQGQIHMERVMNDERCLGCTWAVPLGLNSCISSCLEATSSSS